MKLKILGTRGEIKESTPYHSKKSGILLDDTILIDCGDERFLDYDPICILCTHLHPDHAFFVRHPYTYDIKPRIYAPQLYKNYSIHVTNDPFTINGYHIAPIPTIHSVKVKSNAYLIEYKRKKILYTGDMIWLEKKYHLLLLQCDLIITEASFIREGGIVRRDKKTDAIWGHTGVPNLIKLFKKFTHKMVFTHFGAWFFKNIPEARKEFKKLAQENKIELIVGYDGLEVTV